MKQCPTCGKEYGDEVEVCPIDKTLLSPEIPPETHVAYPPPVDPAGETQVDPEDTESKDPIKILAALDTRIPSSTLPPFEADRPRTSKMGLDETAQPVSGVMEPGTIWGAYRLLKLLGKGGMGEVYLAEHRKLGRKVALKLLRSRFLSDRDAVKRFFREARIVNQIRHPNIVEITDFVENDSGSSYFIMELLEGQTLGRRRARQGILPVAETIEIAIQICDALIAIHDAGIVHRDLKPDNVFLTMSMKGGPDQIKLLDFGLVKLPEPVRGESQLDTNPETLLGTPEYMSPEQIRGLPSVDHLSDIYSLGTILYECVAGIRPITGPTFGELLVNVVTEKPTLPSQLEIGETPPLPPGLEELIMSCLEKDPEDRPQSAAEIKRALVAIAEGQEVTIALPTLRKKEGQRRRKRLFAGTAAAGFAAVLALVVVLVYGSATEQIGPGRGPIKTIKHAAKRPGKPIARLVEMWRTVHHRTREGRSWVPARREMGLHNLDVLRTGGGARAQVAFIRGSKMDVAEQTEVLIQEPEEEGDTAQMVAHVRRGTIRATAKPGAPIRLITPDGKSTLIAARGDEPVSFRVIKGKKGLELAVLKGAATVRAGEKSVELESNQLVEVKGDGVSAPVKLPPFPQLEAPGVDAKLPQGSQVAVRWKAVEGMARYRVQLSHFIGFDEKIVNQVAQSTTLELKGLKAETYIWRVRSIDEAGHEGEFGYARRFTILPGDSPVDEGDKILLSPVPSAVVEYAKRQLPVTFRWRKAGRLHRVVVARSPRLNRFVVLRRRTPGTSTAITGLKPGVYYWGVYVLEGRKWRRLFKRPRRLVIVQRTAPKVHLPSIKWK